MVELEDEQRLPIGAFGNFSGVNSLLNFVPGSKDMESSHWNNHS